MPDQIFIQRRFEINQENLIFQDALIIPKADYDLLTEEQIEAMKQERFMNWKASIAQGDE